MLSGIVTMDAIMHWKGVEARQIRLLPSQARKRTVFAFLMLLVFSISH